MGNALYEMKEELDLCSQEYVSLLDNFYQNGDIDVFVDVQNRLLDLKYRAEDLPNREERLEIVDNINAYLSTIEGFLHS